MGYTRPREFFNSLTLSVGVCIGVFDTPGSNYHWNAQIIKFIIVLALVVGLGGLLTSLGMALSSKSLQDREKSRPFECGFDPKTVSRLPFSLRFFLIAVIFLIFDVELLLIFPVVLRIFSLRSTAVGVTLVIFLVILFAGLIHESNQGSLDWAR